MRKFPKTLGILEHAVWAAALKAVSRDETFSDCLSWTATTTRIAISIPGERVVVTHEDPGGPGRSLVMAVHDAFDVARRRVDSAVR